MTPPIVSITIEPAPDGPAETDDGLPDLLGLGEVALERVVALTLAQAGIGQPVELSVVVTSDATLRRLNGAYRGRDEATDVLSFPLLDTPLVRAPADQLWGAAGPDEDEPPTARAAGEHMAGGVEDDADEADDADDLEAEDDDDETPFAFVAPPDAPTHLGDIVIARGVARRQAAVAGHAAGWELAYLVAHGVLHLIGYDDHTEAGYAAMVAQQECVLQQAGISHERRDKGTAP